MTDTDRERLSHARSISLSLLLQRAHVHPRALYTSVCLCICISVHLCERLTFLVSVCPPEGATGSNFKNAQSGKEDEGGCDLSPVLTGLDEEVIPLGNSDAVSCECICGWVGMREGGRYT